MIVNTLDELLEFADQHRTPDCTCSTCVGLNALAQLLMTPCPGDFDVEVGEQHGMRVVYIGDIITLPPDEARGLGVALIRGADRAESR